MHQMSAMRLVKEMRGTPVVSVVGNAVLRAEPDEAMVLVTLSALRDTPGPAVEDVARRKWLSHRSAGSALNPAVRSLNHRRDGSRRL
jgi:hypothetical protein